MQTIKHRGGDKINLTDLYRAPVRSLRTPFPETSPISNANVFASMKGVTVRVRVGHYENFELEIRSVDKLGGARLLIIVKLLLRVELELI